MSVPLHLCFFQDRYPRNRATPPHPLGHRHTAKPTRKAARSKPQSPQSALASHCRQLACSLEIRDIQVPLQPQGLSVKSSVLSSRQQRRRIKSFLARGEFLSAISRLWEVSFTTHWTYRRLSIGPQQTNPANNRYAFLSRRIPLRRLAFHSTPSKPHTKPPSRPYTHTPTIPSTTSHTNNKASQSTAQNVTLSNHNRRHSVRTRRLRGDDHSPLLHARAWRVQSYCCWAVVSQLHISTMQRRNEIAVLGDYGDGLLRGGLVGVGARYPERG